MVARSWIARILDRKKLYRLARPTLLGMLTPTGRPRDANAETGGQRLADAEARGQRPADAEAEGQISEGQTGPKSRSGGLRLAGSGPELEDK